MKPRLALFRLYLCWLCFRSAYLTSKMIVSSGFKRTDKNRFSGKRSNYLLFSVVPFARNALTSQSSEESRY